MTGAADTVIVSGAFDDIRSSHLRLLQEASRIGRLHVLLWSDSLCTSLTGESPKFPADERRYVLQAIRFVDQVLPLEHLPDADALPVGGAVQAGAWVVHENQATPRKQAFCQAHGIEYKVLRQEDLAGLPDCAERYPAKPGRAKKVLVTGCFDWLHSGHVRFLEEVSELGRLYVVVGSDRAIKGLKGGKHPMFGQDERRYMVQCVRYVEQALISSGTGWLDAEQEILRIKPDIYAVNEDGDKPVKREFCREQGIEYRVLRRVPKQGLARRTSTVLRGY